MYLAEFARHANTARRNRVLVKRRGTNFAGQPVWTPEEEDTCRKLYPDYAALQRALSRRTYHSIRARCRHLGIAKTKRQFTAREVSDVRRMYGRASDAELKSHFAHRNHDSIRYMAQRLGVRRPRPRYTPTGDELLDELREQCFRKGLSMPDLDQYARSKHYFARGTWLSARSFNYRHIVKAIHELGGKLTIEWSD
jgi:hypothetical protein